jgi:MFS family permease
MTEGDLAHLRRRLRWVASIMKPFTRELISDRRQPALRWSAVFAGVAVAVALWSVLQMLGMGVGLSALDIDDAGSFRHVRIGNSVWSMLAPLIALAVGGLVAGKLAATLEQRVGALHGFVVGALSSVIGLVLTVSIVSMLAGSTVSTATSRFLSGNHYMIVSPHMRDAERAAAAKEMGKILFGAGAALLVGIGAAVAGGALGVKPLHKRHRRGKHDTEEVPVVPPPGAPPTDAPHVMPRVDLPNETL